jgi:hypothetical protein
MFASLFFLTQLFHLGLMCRSRRLRSDLEVPFLLQVQWVPGSGCRA